WLDALWESEAPPPNWLHGWLRSEQRAAGRPLDVQRIDAVLAGQQFTEDDVRQVAAGLIAGRYLAPNPALVARANELSVLLEAADTTLPVRAAWLARLGLAGLHGGDALALARTRDRLLQQLLDNGLSRDRDLPAFLRHGDSGDGAASAVDRERLATLHRKAMAWARGKMNHEQLSVELIFAFGFAELTQTPAAQELLAAAERTAARQQGQVSQWLLRAYRHRVAAVLDGHRPGGALPADLMRELATMPEGKERSVNLRRRVSRILEPFERIDPFRGVREFRDDAIGRELAELADVMDADELAKRLGRLRKRAGTPRARLRVLGTSLTFGPRLGEPFAAEILAELVSAVKSLVNDPDAGRTVDVLETALLLAAHVGREEFVAPLTGQLRALLEPLRGERLAWLLAPLSGRLFRTLGKLGLHDETGSLVNQLFEQMLEGRTLAQLRRRQAVNWPIVLRALLQIAGGWYYIGLDDEATEILDEVRARLFPCAFRGEDQTELATAYATILGQAPPEVAWPRIHELFDRLGELASPSWGNSHYLLCEMRTIEAAVLAVVAKDFASSSAVRRWLDEDEYLVRRRIHRDMREVVERPG
ncbi:MAG: hypothetical protein ACJ8F7_02830, partial [Gemmataceae bacterium]